MSITVFTSHLPPSTNNLYANIPGKGRVRSQRYRDWQAAAGWDFNGKGCINGPFTLAITVCASKRRKGRDLSNFIKPLEDLLVVHGVVEDDSLAQSITIEWGEALGGVRMQIKPEVTS